MSTKNDLQDEFGNRMKGYENVEAMRKLDLQLPIVARLDGRAFSKFTSGLKRPYDEQFIELMQRVTEELVKEFNPVIAYQQSDEITLVFLDKNPEDSSIMFSGRSQKLCSILAAYATAMFVSKLPVYLPNHPKKIGMFDCRIWNVPTLMEAANTVIWRENDARKNSVSMLAQHHFSHKTLQEKSTKQKIEMLNEIGVDWNKEPKAFQRGTFFKTVSIEREFTPEELENLPPKHQAHRNPNLLVKRKVTKLMDFPRLSSIQNICDVLFSETEVGLILKVKEEV